MDQQNIPNSGMPVAEDRTVAIDPYLIPIGSLVAVILHGTN